MYIRYIRLFYIIARALFSRGLGARAQKPVFWARFWLKRAKTPKWHFFSGLGARGMRDPLLARAQGSHQVSGHLAPKRPRNRPRKSKIAKKKYFFLRYLALAPLGWGRDPLFITYSRSPRPHRSNGVSHSPNLEGEPPQKWLQSWYGGDFWGQNGVNPPRTCFFTISPPEGVQTCVRCLTRGFLGC